MDKKCSDCKQRKPLVEFHKDSGSKDGYAVRCKTCAATCSRAHYLKNQDRIRQYAREYVAKNKERVDQVRREYRANNKDKTARNRRNYRERHAARVAAGLKLQWAIESGKKPRAIELTCETCGKQAQEYHHPDYSKPLDVVPLCRSCHRMLHARIKASK